MKYRQLLIGLLATAALVPAMAIACGDDDDDESDGGDPTTTSEATGTADSTGSPSATSAGSPTGDASGGELVIYAGRSEALVAPIIERFEEESGIDVEVKYGNTTELAALLAEEGEGSPADVYFSQDAGALGAIQKLDMLEPLDQSVLDLVDPLYRSATGEWIGITARARVIVYNPDMVAEADLPTSLLELTDPKWNGMVGWAPTNASFQSQMTAFRVAEGDDAAREWLEAMKANGVKDYPGNGDIVSAVAAGEVSLGLVNHYYLWGFIQDQGEDFNAMNHYTAAGDVGSLVNVAGAAVLASSENKEEASQFIEFLLSDEGQTYFSEETFEYPLATGVAADDRLVPLSEIQPPDIDLSDIDDLEGTLTILRETGVLP